MANVMTRVSEIKLHLFKITKIDANEIFKYLTPFVHFENKMSQASAQKLGNISFEVDFKT